MASGKPLLGAISGEGKGIIEESNCGLACEAEDYNKLAQLAQQMYEMNIEERKMLGENGIKYFKESFDREILLKKINTLLTNEYKEKEYV